MNGKDVTLKIGNYYGIRSVNDFSYGVSSPSLPIMVAGIGVKEMANVGKFKAQLDYSQHSFFDDPIREYAFNFTTINAEIGYKSGGIISSYIGKVRSYSLSASYGSFPVTSASIEFFGGNDVSGIQAANQYPEPTLITPQTIEISGLGTTEYLTEFNYSIENEIGEEYGNNDIMEDASSLYLSGGLYLSGRQESFSITMEISAASLENLSGLMASNLHNYTINYKNKSGTTIFSLNLINFKLNSQTISAGTRDEVQLKMSFIKNS